MMSEEEKRGRGERGRYIPHWTLDGVCDVMENEAGVVFSVVFSVVLVELIEEPAKPTSLSVRVDMSHDTEHQDKSNAASTRAVAQEN